MFKDLPEGQTGSCSLCNEAGKKIEALTKERDDLKKEYIRLQEILMRVDSERDRYKEALLELKHQSHHLISEEMWRIEAAIQAQEGPRT